MRASVTLGLLLPLLIPAPARATPGPDSVVVIANANVPESVALAQRYAEARDVPTQQVCLLDVADQEDLSLADYEATFLTPLRACLDAGGVRERIEAAALIRGVPLRVQVPDGGSDRAVSLAAALMLWDSETAPGEALLGQAPGRSLSCGASSCYGAAWANPFTGFSFEPGFELASGGVTWRPILATMLHGRSYADAERLLDSALEAEASDGLSGGEFLFMDGADSARGALDFEYAAVMTALTDRGLTATRVPFDANLTGRDLSSFLVGTASLGETIEGNTFRAGSLVDNLTSFGARPVNFRETGEAQVSIARWVAQGVAGAHGTVDEPLNNCFPSRRFLVRYADGSTLAEAFHAEMPYVYWRNLVLGDPMAAPFAVRPTVSVSGVEDGARVAGAVPLVASAEDPGGRGISSLVVYLDGVEVARGPGDAPIDECLPVEAGAHTLLVVARAADDLTDARPHRPKGWLARRFDADGGSASCAPPAADGGPGSADASAPSVDAGLGGADAGPGGGGDAGCGCRAAGDGGGPARGAAFGLASLAWFAGRRSRGRKTRGPRAR